MNGTTPVNVSDVIDDAKLNPLHLHVVGFNVRWIFFGEFDLQAISYVGPAVTKILNMRCPKRWTIWCSSTLMRDEPRKHRAS